MGLIRRLTLFCFFPLLTSHAFGQELSGIVVDQAGDRMARAGAGFGW